MRSIVSVNTIIPGHDDYEDYDSGASLKDYDIILFDPKLPRYSRQYFTAGGSCVNVDDAQVAARAIGHWNHEINDAMTAGKTIFFLLDTKEEDQFATGSTSGKSSRTFQTQNASNYDVLPFSLEVRNSQGKKLKLIDNRFTDLFAALGAHMSYKVVLPTIQTRKVFTTQDGGSALGTVIRLKGRPGNLVMLPYLNLSYMYEGDDDEDEEDYVWTKEGLGLATRLKKQLVAIDTILRHNSEATPAPTWLDVQPKTVLVASLEEIITKTNEKISKLEEKRAAIERQIADSREIEALLYENGKLLENAVEKALRLLGYEAGNFREGSLEIDHVITSPDGMRMIGEAEGKDTSAVDISKFRQLESNIGEDFERDEVTEPAKGILFGNGYRFTEPGKRKVEFTDKCLLNAKRLNTALVTTSSLYPLAVYLLDNPGDDAFKELCRRALETTSGEIVSFPKISK